MREGFASHFSMNDVREPRTRCSGRSEKLVPGDFSVHEVKRDREPLDLPESKKSMECQTTPAQFSRARELESAQVVADQAESTRSRCKRKRDVINRFYASNKACSYVIVRATEFQMNLEPGMPSFVKYMLQSHVSNPFWLGLPVGFCKLNLPKEDCIITLVDECGKEYKTKFLAEKTGLSGGWRGFSIEHNLVEGDAVVFQLIKATKFKVYIIRANNLAEVDGVPGLVNLDKLSKQIVAENNADKGDGKHSISYPSSVFQENNQNVAPTESVTNPGSAATVEFKDVKNFENFKIIVNGLIVDSELPGHVRVKYYKLCRSQKAFLHDHLEGININCMLVTGIIYEIVNVADAIRACKLTTSQNDLASWDKILNAFEQLGMNVGFLRARLHQIVSLAFESEGAMDSKRYKESMSKRARLEEEIRNLEMKLMVLKEAHASNDKEIENLKLKAERHEMKFQSEVQAPW